MMYVVLIIMLLAIWGNPHEATAICNPTAASVTQNENQMMGAESCDLSGNLRTTLGTLISGEDQPNNLMQTSGGVVRTTTVASAITTDTTSAAATVPTGSKTFAAVLTGTGAIVQTLAIYGSVDNTYTAAVDPLLCTITLSGTTAVGDACAVVTANFAYYFVVSTATSGTSASGVVYAMY